MSGEEERDSLLRNDESREKPRVIEGCCDYIVPNCKYIFEGVADECPRLCGQACNACFCSLCDCEETGEAQWSSSWFDCFDDCAICKKKLLLFVVVGIVVGELMLVQRHVLAVLPMRRVRTLDELAQGQTL